MNKYLGTVHFTSLVYFLEAENEENAKLKIHDELNKMNNQLLLNTPLNNIYVVEIDEFNKTLKNSENKIIEIESLIYEFQRKIKHE